MMMAVETQNQLYSQVVQITQDFLGPASQRFIDRQIKTHINKEPHELQAADIEALSEWLKVAIALLTEDEKTVQAYTTNLHNLAITKQKD